MVDWSNNQVYFLVITLIIVLQIYSFANLCILLFTPPKFTLKYINYTMGTLAFNLADA